MRCDDERAFGVHCPVCWALPGAKCTTPTEYGRRPVSWIHDLRVLELHKNGRTQKEAGAAWPLSTRVRVIKSSTIAQCPYLILDPDHYRDDQTCLCDDPARRRWQG